jgi:4-hydroxybenzoate polyprenyltransferase
MISKLMIYLRLARLDKPVGIYLLLWPSLIGTYVGRLSMKGYIDFENYLIVLAGAILVRSCGCVINDISDYKFDKLVSRTKDRPIAKGEVSPQRRMDIFLHIGIFLFESSDIRTKDNCSNFIVYSHFYLNIPTDKKIFKSTSIFSGHNLWIRNTHILQPCLTKLFDIYYDSFFRSSFMDHKF